jgi:N-acetylglucosaminyldiphosphoundecaprenol N-acetyl-beta-D-mannosaminyltransferase
MTMDETVEWAIGVIRRGTPTQHVVVNAAKLIRMRRDTDLAAIVNGCPVVNADGQAIVWASRLLGAPVPERVTGIDFMGRLLDLAPAMGWRVFFLGADEAVVSRLAAGHAASVAVAGYRHGYWLPGEDADVVNEVARSAADILFVALPSPRKEAWTARYLAELGVPLVVGVGGSFDVLAGRRRRAPAWMQRHGLEWLFRLGQEPARLGPRYLKTNGQFLLLLAWALISRQRAAPWVIASPSP